jgi:probable HAF family extracellular repeat protein
MLKNLLCVSLFCLIFMASHAHALDLYTSDEDVIFEVISADGTAVIGSESSGTQQAILWTAADGLVTLGDVDDGGSSAWQVSADGSVIIGLSNSEIFRWTEDSGMEVLTSRGTGERFSTWGMSADGSVIIGESYTYSEADGGSSAYFRWTENTGIEYLTSLTDYDSSWVNSISADGVTIIGAASSDAETQAVRWTEVDSPEGLGWLNAASDEYRDSWANDLSADGTIIVGASTSDLGRFEAFRWSESTGMVGLGILDGFTSSSASLISADGSTIAGTNSAEDSEAFYWTASTGMIGLGTLGGDYSSPRAISATGDVIVGDSDNGSDEVAFRWTAADGMQSLNALLTADGVDLSGISLNGAIDLSADGTVIIGEGESEDGEFSWILRLDDSESSGESTSGLMTMAGLAQSAATMLPLTESAHALAQESLTTQLRAGLQTTGPANASFNMYASGFGGEWNSYTVGGSIGAFVKISESVRLGGGLFASRYIEDDLALTSEYNVDSQGVALWADYGHDQAGLQLQAILMLADLDHDIQRGYLNGAGINTATANPDGNMRGFMLQLGWKQLLAHNSSISPYLSYARSQVRTDSYTESGGAFPAQFDQRTDISTIVKIGLEAETRLTQNFQLWGQAAYGKRLENNSAGVSGTVVGLMDFSLPGYDLDQEWVEADLGLRWQATSLVSVMTTLGGSANSDQQPDWRSSVDVAVAF